MIFRRKKRGSKPAFSRFSSIPRLRMFNFALLFGFVGILFLVISSAAPSPGFYGSVEQDQVDRINYARSVHGRAGVWHIECLNTVAELWTEKMARAGGISHNPNLANEVSYVCGRSWSRITENVGVGYSSSSIMDAFWNSTGHRNNILDSQVNRVGVGAYWSQDGRLFVTQIFAKCINCGGQWSTNASLPADPASVIGNVDVANCRRIAGWTFDKTRSDASIPVHIYIDGGGYNTGATAVARPDVNNAYGIGGTHGFEFAVPDGYRDGRQHTAYIYGISETGGPHALLGVKTLDACANPIGNIDVVNCSAAAGWAFDMNDPTRSIDTHLYIDGPFGQARAGYNLGANATARPDVSAAYGSYGHIGNYHGFHWNVPSQWKDGRQHSVYIYAINIGQGGHTFLGTRTFGPC
jgi:hypothetical protein